MEPMGKVLAITPEKCTGCRLCEVVCSVFHDGVSNANRSRIKIMRMGIRRALYPHVLPAMSGCSLHDRLPGEGHYPG